MIVWRLLVNALAFYVTAYLIPGVTIEGWTPLLVVSIVWGVIAVLIKPLLVLLTLPVNIMTLGLFTLVINGALLMLTARIVDGFGVEGFGTAVLAAVVLSVINMVMGK